LQLANVVAGAARLKQLFEHGRPKQRYSRTEKSLMMVSGVDLRADPGTVIDHIFAAITNRFTQIAQGVAEPGTARRLNITTSTVCTVTATRQSGIGRIAGAAAWGAGDWTVG
jgi:hypothetical protein